MRLWSAIVFLILLIIVIVTIANFLLPANFVSTFNLAISTVFAALSALGSLLTIQEMRHERLERSQPSIFIDFEVTNSQFVYWVVRNTGSGPARNLTFAFTPTPINHNGQPLTILPFFQHPLSILAPNAEVRQLIGFYPKMKGANVPLAFKASVAYDSDVQHGIMTSFNVDLTAFDGMVVPPKTLNENLESIGKELHELRRSMGNAFWMSRLRVEVTDPISIASEKEADASEEQGTNMDNDQVHR